MHTRTLEVILIILLLAGCSNPSPPSTPAAMTAEPATTDTVTPAAEPTIYSTSLLATRWDKKARHHLLSPVNPATGEPIPGYASIDLGVNYSHAFSPDRKILAVISYISDSPTHPVLHIIDTMSWKEKTLKLELTGWGSAITFSPDGASIAASLTYRDSNLLIIDLKQNAVRALIQADFNPTRIQFTRDGTDLMAYGSVLVDRFTVNERSESDARVALFDAGDLSLRWSAEAAGLREGSYPVDASKTTDLHQPGNGIYFYPGVVFAPNADKLYAVHADEEKLTTVDFASRSIETIDIAPELTLFERFLMLGTGTAHAKVANGTSITAVISPDGEVIYTTGMKHEAFQQSGNWEYKSTPLGLQAIRAADGTLLFEKDVYADWLSMAPDGGRLILFSWGEGDPGGNATTDIFDLGSSEFSQHFGGAQLTPAHRMDGNLVLVSAMTMSNSSQATRMAIHDYTTGDLIAEWVSPTYASWFPAP